MSKTPLIIFAFFFGLLLSSCGDAAEPDATGPSQLDAFWSAAAPDGAREVLDVRSNTSQGDQVVVKGRIQDFVDGRSFIKLADSALKSCLDLDGADCSCPTPWDYCCEDLAKRKTHIISVGFHDEGGRLLRESLKGFQGLDHLQTITVTGTVDKDDAGNVTVVATSLCRE
jgi:hypothetical protein